MIKCLVADDEPVARKVVREYIESVDFLQLVEETGNVLQATQIIDQTKIDLIFLDIQMPEQTGIEWLRDLANPPMVILTTAHAEYALEGYALNVVDYLLKPIRFTRFLQATQKARDFLSLKDFQSRINPPDFFFIKCNQKLEKIFFNDIIYIESLGHYVTVYTERKKYITYLTTKGIEEQLPEDQFIRIHKSYVISLNHITAITSNQLIARNINLPVSRYYKNQVADKVKKFLIKRGGI